MYPLVIPSGTGETLFSADLLSTDVFFGYHVWFTLDESPYRNDLISQPPTILWPVGESLVPKHWVHGDWQLTGWKPIGPSKHHNFCHQSFVFFFFFESMSLSQRDLTNVHNIFLSETQCFFAEGFGVPNFWTIKIWFFHMQQRCWPFLFGCIRYTVSKAIICNHNPPIFWWFMR